MKKKPTRIFIFIMLIITFCAGLLLYFKPTSPTHIQEISYSDFKNQISKGNFKYVNFQDDQTVALAESVDGTFFTTNLLKNDQSLNDLLAEKHVNVDVNETQKPGMLNSIIGSIVSALIFAVVLFLFIKFTSPKGSSSMFGKSISKKVDPSENKIRFVDVAGCDEAKEEVAEIVNFLKNPQDFTKIGAKMIKGVLMSGPPGTGKTLLAKAIAGEAGVPFFTASGSEFVEMFVGVGASRVRSLFEEAKKHAPAIIFIDEIDALGRARGGNVGGGDSEREQTLNQLLVEMNGFQENSGIIVLAATNRPDVLDPALRRPGRFDREVVVSLPDIKGREQILKVHSKKVKLEETVDLKVIARGTPGFSGAELENLVNEAALFAGRAKKSIINMLDFEEAKDKIIMGFKRENVVMPEKERISTAWHEAGHAIVAKFTENADPLHKVTIIPRGRALGVTMQLPLEDRYGYDIEDLLTNISVLLAGRLAEQIFLQKISTGASNDIERATSIAKNMVMSWGMSSLGMINFGDIQGNGFKGSSAGGSNGFSEETGRKIDEEVSNILKQQYEKTTNILIEHAREMQLLAEALLEKETLDIKEMDYLFEHGELPTEFEEVIEVKDEPTELPEDNKLGKKIGKNLQICSPSWGKLNMNESISKVNIN